MPNGKTKCFVDTNLLVYALDPAETVKQPLMAALLIGVLRSRTLVLSPQSLNECYRILTRGRRPMPRDRARRFVAMLSRSCTAPLAHEITYQAWKLEDAGFSWWDCLLLSSALAAGCGVFLSEDMQHGRELGHMVILNPFRFEAGHDFSK